MSKANRGRQQARARVAQMRAAEARKRRRNWIVGIGAAVVLIIAVFYIGLTFVADVLNAAIDPRMRTR